MQLGTSWFSKHRPERDLIIKGITGSQSLGSSDCEGHLGPGFQMASPPLLVAKERKGSRVEQLGEALSWAEKQWQESSPQPQKLLLQP